MKKFFVNNGNWLSMILSMFVFFIGLPKNYIPEFSSSILTNITYLIVVFLPVSLSIYYRNKK